jgi:inositol transport system substrate-binding protein
MPARKLVVLSLVTSHQEFQRQQEVDARAAAAKAGLDVAVEFAENDPARQIGQLEEWIRRPPAERPVAFVAETVAAIGFEKVARAAVAARIGWVVISARAPYLELLRRDHPGALITSATPDDLEIGRIQAQQLRALLPQGGPVLYVEGPTASAATNLRRRMAEDGLKGSPVRLAHCVTGDWLGEAAETAVGAWLDAQGPAATFVAVCAQNDEMAMGARRAVTARRPAWSGPFTGCDGLPAGGQRWVEDGQLTATVVKPTTAGQGVDLVASALGGAPVPPHLVLQPRSFPELEALRR